MLLGHQLFGSYWRFQRGIFTISNLSKPHKELNSVDEMVKIWRMQYFLVRLIFMLIILHLKFNLEDFLHILGKGGEWWKIIMVVYVWGQKTKAVRKWGARVVFWWRNSITFNGGLGKMLNMPTELAEQCLFPFIGFILINQLCIIFIPLLFLLLYKIIRQICSIVFTSLQNHSSNMLNQFNLINLIFST